MHTRADPHPAHHTRNFQSQLMIYGQAGIEASIILRKSKN